MDFKKFGNFNWIEMDSKDQNLDLNKTNPFLSISFHFRLLGTSAMMSYITRVQNDASQTEER